MFITHTSSLGWRSEMEDSHLAEVDFDIPGASFYAVFDGHGGSQMSKEA